MRVNLRQGTYTPTLTPIPGVHSAFDWTAGSHALAAAGQRDRVRQHEELRMSKLDHSRVIHFAEAQAGIPGPSGQRSISLLRHGSLDVKLSQPLPPNEQTPHAQDEVYVVFRGRGVLLHDGKREA